MNLSLVVNVFLLIVKVYAYWASTSKAILASAADSLVDIASQLVIAYAEYKVRPRSFHTFSPHVNCRHSCSMAPEAATCNFEKGFSESHHLNVSLALRY